MSRPQLLPESPSEQDTAKFLRRFSELVAVGQSASYLRHAAGLIDELIDRVRQTEALLHQQTADNADNLALRRRAEAEAMTARQELAPHAEALADLQDKFVCAQHSFAAERADLTGRIARAESRLAEADAELRRLRARLAAIGPTHAIVPMQTLRLLQTQLVALAGEFQRGGDLVSVAMCEVSICVIDQTLAAEPGRRNMAIRTSA
ncbi:hypothetical protein HUU61_02695 [Rhodopseudomonas palustris]|nr:hypothetical protein [Rhodopseudomonas palustris]